MIDGPELLESIALVFIIFLCIGAVIAAIIEDIREYKKGRKRK